MWECECKIEREDNEVCNICGMALEEEDNSIDTNELNEILDDIEVLVTKARKIINRSEE